MQVGDEVFISYPSAVQYKEKGLETAAKGTTALNELLWGDWCQIKEISGSWYKVRTRGNDGWLKKENLQPNRILEVNFVDIGQGDGCHIQTPKDKTIVIDAGEGDNMFRFLSWRFGRFKKKFTFDSFIISHPDKDHYNGFSALFEHEKVFVKNVYHNSIIEQIESGKNSLGTKVKEGRNTYLTGVVGNLTQLKSITDSAAKRGKRIYPNMLKTAVDSGRVDNIAGLSASTNLQAPNYLPGYEPGNATGMTMRILSPVLSEFATGKFGLPWFGDEGKTKNGHSVAILLEIGSVKMLLGGDLNEPSQEYLLEHYTGLSAHPHSAADLETLVNEARAHFEVDITKACHHGSAHVSPVFLQATNPLVTIISSGDNEPHSHPRPDTLGLIGKFSRSNRPLIFSTELARSGNESIKHPNLVRSELKSKMNDYNLILNNPNATVAQKAKAEEKLNEALKVIERSVANYGMINVRTDGNKVIIAQRLERERGKNKRWDIYHFETDSRNRLNFIP